MSYPGTINSLTEKTDGPDQIIYAAHMNAIRTALLDAVTIIGNAPQGNKTSIEDRLDVNINDDGFIDNIGQLRIVGKSGCKYSTIQSAIDSITDATTAKPYAILVLPGVYTETITTKNNIYILGITPPTFGNRTQIPNGPCKIVAPNGQSAVIGVSAFLANFIITSSQSQALISADSGGNNFKDCIFYCTGSGPAFTRTSGIIYCSDSIIMSEASIPLILAGSNSWFRRCSITSIEGGAAFTLSDSAKLYLNSCILDVCEGTIPVAAGCTLYARFCQFTTAPSGDGTINLGTMTNSNCDVWSIMEM